MIIISIDVGIRNLAYIIIEVNELNKHNILKWEVIELCDKTEKACDVNNVKIGKNLNILFNEKLKDYKIDKIIIENQIGQNAIKMKTIQGMINMYFIMNNYDINDIINYNAIHKLKYFINNKKTTYSERKKLSKEITKKLCDSYYNEEIKNYYKNFKKKEDLADCLLQCIDYMKKINYIDDNFYLKNKIYNEIS